MLIIDRFEGDHAIVETDSGVIMNIPRSELPPSAKEGAALRLVIDSEESRPRIDDMLNSLSKS